MNFLTSVMQTFLVLGLLLASATLTVAVEPDVGVSLMLSTASSEQSLDGTLFRCEVVIVNDTENALSVTSNFFSAFDGLELVVTDVDGNVLKQQPYVFHQSPFTLKGRAFLLQPGKTKASLSFPIAGFGKAGQQFKVRLVGTLPGSKYTRILSTETLKVVVVKRAGAAKVAKP